MADPSPEELMRQASTMANQGGPGKNTPAADSWLQSQFEKYGYATKSANSSGGSGGSDWMGTAANIGTAILGGVTNPIGTATGPGATAAKSPAITDWLSNNAANYGLVIFGALLAIGALLISQKQTIIQVGKIAAEAAI